MVAGASRSPSPCTSCTPPGNVIPWTESDPKPSALGASSVAATAAGRHSMPRLVMLIQPASSAVIWISSVALSASMSPLAAAPRRRGAEVGEYCGATRPELETTATEKSHLSAVP